MSGSKKFQDMVIGKWPIVHGSWDFLKEVPPGDGLLLEFGVGFGQTFQDICRAVKPRTVYGFDWFHGLPIDWWTNPKGTFSTGGEPPPTEDNGKLVVGLVEDTLVPFLEEHKEPIAFIHFDLDIYGPTKHCLYHVGPRLQNGAILTFDEIVGQSIHIIQHEQKAFKEFLDETGYDIEFVFARGWDKMAFRIIKE